MTLQRLIIEEDIKEALGLIKSSPIAMRLLKTKAAQVRGEDNKPASAAREQFKKLRRSGRIDEDFAARFDALWLSLNAQDAEQLLELIDSSESL